ncbi:MAG: cell division protein FtsZ, partial [Verrucomicrobiota bacterium]
DVTISQSVRSIIGLIQRPGLIRIGFDDLLAALRSPSGRCVFGYGESDSDNRAHDALTQALKNPLMDRGRMLADASHVLVQVSGGPGMTLTEVEILMKDLGKHIHDDTQIIFGTAVDSRMGNRLSVTLISSLAGEKPAAEVVVAKAKPAAVLPKPAPPEAEPVVPAAASTWEQIEEPAPPLVTEVATPVFEAATFAPELIEEEQEAASIEPEPVSSATEEPQFEEPPPPRVILPRKKPNLFKEPKPVAEKKPQAKQEMMQFEPVTRGRFEKSEPTIVEGQDLDVPTFLRKNVRVK